MQFNKINNLVGWAVCLIACSVYVMTAEPGGSFWDCGEFVSSCFKLQIPHPPGAPLFVLLGRIFIVAFGDDPMTAARAVNIMSALASGFTILFLFWTITHFARRIAGVKVSDVLNPTQVWTIMGAGVVGALAYTFSDSFWYSAVEGEVYALSSFFTAIVFWAILKWEAHADEPGADRWIVFIFFLMGLSIGVHLLNLLTIPAIVMVYYFRRRDRFPYAILRTWFFRLLGIGAVLGILGALFIASSEASEDAPMDGTLATLILLGSLAALGIFFLIEKYNKEKKEIYGGTYIFFLLSCLILGFTLFVVIPYSIKAAGYFDRVFVNSFELPFFAGFAFFFVLLGLAIRFGLKQAAKRGWQYLTLALWSIVFLLIGYSSYITTLLRSNADPSVDMYNVDNPMSLVGYLGRDQYGDFPLVYGAKFTARPYSLKNNGMRYQKSGDKYVEIGEDKKYMYQPEDKMVFPRVWDASNEQFHADYYAQVLGIGKKKDGSYDTDPTQRDNLAFFASYQVYFMYFRYFMWNFSGKQNDNQGFFNANLRDGNWITGITPIDNIIYGDQNKMPDSLKNNKAHNRLFMLPLILGLIGLFFHFRRHEADAWINLLLFFFTGFAIILYLNQPGNQPRERDYAYVGSFYAFAVWIGLGVMQVNEWLSRKMSKTVAASLATLLCLAAVPAIMAQQEWDDHDRSQKKLPGDLARNYLESCAPNAILISYGDNDTYPLWYAQEVEGVRPDVRVVNYSLLGIDWYINQLRYKVNQSDSIDVIWNKQQIEGSKRDFVFYNPVSSIPEDRYYDLEDMMRNYVGSDDKDKTVEGRDEGFFNTFPVRKMAIPVDVDLVKKNGTVNDRDSVLSEVRFEIPKNGLAKNDLALLNIIAANHWKRPIYFTNPETGLGIDSYIRRDGLTYRLVPVKESQFNTNWAQDKMMNKFVFGNADKAGVYFDEENRRHLGALRTAYAELALSLSAEGRFEEAKKAVQKADKMLNEANFPYGLTNRYNIHNRNSLLFMQACTEAGELALAKKISSAVKKDLQQQMQYYESLKGNKREFMEQEIYMAEDLLNRLNQLTKPDTSNPILIPGKAMRPADSPTLKF
ncbi:MAG: protein O-mannosyl-transferase family [Sediminibacterium sp.]